MSSETALYVRVSTDDQNLARQKEETWNYAVEQLNVPPSEISVYEDKGTGRDTHATTTRSSCVAYARAMWIA